MEKLQFTGVNLHQGDVQMFQIFELPEDIKILEKRFIAASERSGSFHALFGNYNMYEDNNNQIVLEVKEECILNHSLESMLKSSGISMNTKTIIEKKDHRHTIVPKGIYFVGIQNRFNPLKGYLEEVKD